MPFALYSRSNVDYHFKRANLHVQPSTDLPSTLANRIETQHEKLKSFNHLPLKSHTKYMHISPSLTHFTKVLNAIQVPQHFL
jgi:hypothetical protein